ncbi:hypothetical protein [Flavobacterium sp. GCM10027622]|uniref:hypothetical protein n=1 Tax=unclassified Flavobacterium TaxID=196869 RepID=UPI00360E5A87
MNLNIAGYVIFLIIISYIILVVGKICYRNGNIYVASLIPEHMDLCQQINKMLLIGYYLVNLGYSAMTIVNWEAITSIQQLVEIIATKTAIIVLLLSLLHYTTIFILTNYIQKLIK